MSMFTSSTSTANKKNLVQLVPILSQLQTRSHSSSPQPTTTPNLPCINLLKHESDLLHLLFHRNKNQHKCSKWWKYLCMLRSNLRKLILELSGLGELERGGNKSATTGGVGMTKTQLKKLRKAEKEKATGKEKENPSSSAVDQIFHSRTRITARIRLLRKAVLPNAWFAFSCVVATTQFSALGMVLLGVLARVYEGIGPGSLEEQEEMRAVRGRKWKDVDEGWEEGRYGFEKSDDVGGMKRSGWVEGEGLGDLDEGFDDGGVVIARKYEEVEDDDDDKSYGNRDEKNLVESMDIEEKEKADDFNDDTGLLQHPSLPPPPEEATNLLPILPTSSPPFSLSSRPNNNPQTNPEKQRPPLQDKNEDRKEKKKRKNKNKEKSQSSSSHIKPTSTPNPNLTSIPDIELDFFSSTPASISATTTTSTSTSTSKPKNHPTIPAKRKKRPEESLVSSGMLDKDKLHKKAKKKKGNTIDDLFEGLI